MLAPVVAIAPECIDAVGAALADAFDEDPLQRYVLPDADERRARSPAHFAALVRDGIQTGEVVTTPTLDGAAIWLPPDPRGAGAVRGIADALGRDAFARFGHALDYLSTTHADSVPARCWYLVVVGVVPARRRSGVGRALLEPLLRRADATALPCCLDTAQPDIRAFYEQLGFRVVFESIDTVSGIRFWTYRRDPT